MPALHLLLQTYLTLLGSTVLIPFICVPPMGGSPTGEEPPLRAALLSQLTSEHQPQHASAASTIT
jgi:hypothetical protein